MDFVWWQVFACCALTKQEGGQYNRTAWVIQALPLSSVQEAQVTTECAIPQKFHRSIMGPKGSRIQQITRDYGVQIKFPDREENPGMG